ncbi:MAG: FHA domain-containing protein [Aeriscardovia sp.]|nr:FHA domain-containing protein [Aeriscardovia sp.]
MDSTDRNWLVTVVDTGQKGLFRPGDLVIIGRTPQHLPTPGSSFRRFNIDNPQKSMSKRHLSLQVDEAGNATIKDLGSTNGTYLVKKSGALVKLPTGQEFILDKSPVRLQLGNIGIVLEKTDAGLQKEEGGESGDLFSHSSSGPSAARSVKDIREAMEEREGEPTFLIDADRVAEKVKEKREKAQADPDGKTPSNQGEEAEKAEEPEKESQEAPSESGSDIQKMQEENRAKAELVDRAIEESLKKEAPAVVSSPSTVPLPSGAAAGDPNSLFERLTRGERNRETVVRLANGMTSEDAKRTESFAKQFELAKHREMLPFLALNPYLYADLYTWLEALGDPVINAALQTNRGYQTFKSEGGNE